VWSARRRPYNASGTAPVELSGYASCFCSNEYLRGTDLMVIMAISGHRSHKSFMRYIKVSGEQFADKLEQIWAERVLNLSDFNGSSLSHSPLGARGKPTARFQRHKNPRCRKRGFVENIRFFQKMLKER